MRARPAGEGSVIFYFDNPQPGDGGTTAHGLMRALDRLHLTGVLDCVPGRESLMVRFDPLLCSARDVISVCESLSTGANQEVTPRGIEMPVLYEGEDLDRLAARAGISRAEVVRLHSSREYTVYFIGFMPGFPYMGPLPEPLRLPRLSTPRIRVPAGSVAVAEELTGIYPASSPGGWHLLGRTPLRLFDPEQDPPALLLPGDMVRFRPVSAGEFNRLASASGDSSWKR